MTPATIFARATAPGRAALAIVRVSGPAVRAVCTALTGSVPPPRRARLSELRGKDGAVLDEALVLFFAAPASATGEDVLELHLHGGRAVTEAVLRELARLPDMRPAEPGEFSRRAFLAGKLDLAAAEGIAALIDAETEAQRRQALRQMEGVLGRQTESWREALIETRALIEASIDFSDEGEISDFSAAAAVSAKGLAREIGTVLESAGQGERLREGAVIVVAGPPNAGKSSLLNALVRREAAIVTAIAGTTRDPIEVALDLDGYPVILVDTAGLRETADVVELEGIRRTRSHIERADLVLWVEDATAPGAELPPDGAWLVLNKLDLVEVWEAPSSWPGLTRPSLPSRSPDFLEMAGSSPAMTNQPPAEGAGRVQQAGITWPISAATGAGMTEFRAALAETAALLMGAGEGALVTRLRHCLALEDARDALERCHPRLSPELLAEELRLASDALGRITGRIDAELVLDAVFGRFCIGK